jgi:hypothetical protein
MDECVAPIARERDRFRIGETPHERKPDIVPFIPAEPDQDEIRGECPQLFVKCVTDIEFPNHIEVSMTRWAVPRAKSTFGWRKD